MAACATQKFSGVTGSVWDCIVAKVEAEFGIVISSDQGETSKDGFTLEWDYERSSLIMSITCTDSPFWAPCSTINGKIHDLVDACM